MNELICSLDRKITQSVKQERRGTITCRCPEMCVPFRLLVNVVQDRSLILWYGPGSVPFSIRSYTPT